MQNDSYYRPLRLPSSGIKYEEIIYIRPPRIDYILLIADSFYNLSGLERTIAFLKRHISIDPLKLYSADFHYIWAMYYPELFKKHIRYKKDICIYCKEINKVKIDLRELPDIKYLNHDEKELYSSLEYDNLKIVYEEREIKDSFVFGSFEMNTRDKDIDDNKKILHYLYPQIREVHFDGNKERPQDIFEILKYSNISNNIIDDMFKCMTNKRFGMDDKFEFICKKCNKQNQSDVFNDLEELIYFTPDKKLSKEYKNISDYYKSVLSMVKFGLITHEEYNAMSFNHIEQFSDAVGDTDLTFKVGGGF